MIIEFFRLCDSKNVDLLSTRHYSLDMDALKRFGEKVREQRIKRGLSQEELAELSGLHRTYISSLELGKRNVSLINIYALAKALGVTPDKLLKPE